jgi:membrane protease YdiL (CAAX protease family)
MHRNKLQQLHHRHHGGGGVAHSSTGSAGEEPLAASIQTSSSLDQPLIDASNSIDNSANNGSNDSNNNGAGSTPSKTTATLLPLTLPPAPWGISTTIFVMSCWLICFYIAAYDIVPFMLRTLGYSGAAAAGQPAVQALRHLLLDTTQLSITLLLLYRALASHQPRKLGLFSFKFFPLKSWLPTVLLGVAAFPVVDLIHKTMVALLSNSTGIAVSPVSNAAFVAGSANWHVRATWFLVLAVCAPLWEEIMFRGFLLPSLAKYLAPGWAVAASSLVFATVHFTKEGFVPLLLLGCVFGTAYLKTLNLFPAVALHSLWNIALLTQILMSG